MSISTGIHIFVRVGIILSLGFLPVAGLCVKDTATVSIHGVNYSADDFTYIIEDPENSKNTGGGETLGPFEAGGIMCCYELPIVWRSGIRIKVKQEFESRMDKKFAGSSTRVIELPRYIDDKPGELWVLRAADGTIDIVSSDYQPNHPKWPGQVKGWPVASIEYRRYRWSLYIKEAQARIRVAQNALDQLESSPAALVQDSWNLDLKYHPGDLKSYSGPEDKNFIDRVKKKFQEMKLRNEEDVAKLQEQKP